MMNNVQNQIIRRDIRIPYSPDQEYSFYYEDNPVVTALFVILSAMFPPGEMFFIECIRSVRDQVTAPKLQQDIKLFIAQESLHSREHKSLNQYLSAYKYPEVFEIEKRTKERLDILRQLPIVDQLAATVVMEHCTATLARLLLTDRLIQSKTKQETRNLWEWHALEELEHKSVAFDVLTHIGGNTARNRRLALKRITKLITPILYESWFKILKRHDIKFSPTQLRQAIFLTFGGFNRIGMLTKAIIEMRDVLNHNFDPNNMQTEELEAQYRKKLFGEEGLMNQFLKN